jgi:hypothetical protein
MKESGGARAGRGASDSIAGSPVQQIESLSDIASGLQFSNEGSLVVVNEEPRSQLTKQFQGLMQGFRPDVRFIQRFFSAGRDRTIFPASDTKVADWGGQRPFDKSKPDRTLASKRFSFPP